MKLEKAIELLKDLGEGVSLPDMQEYQDAIQMGIEALKHIYELRHHHNVLSDYLLPGETKK
ncbi:hypothetical protein ES703_96048 [subsurface metagenome]